MVMGRTLKMMRKMILFNNQDIKASGLDKKNSFIDNYLSVFNASKSDNLIVILS